VPTQRRANALIRNESQKSGWLLDTIIGWKLKYVPWIHIKDPRKEDLLEKEVKR